MSQYLPFIRLRFNRFKNFLIKHRHIVGPALFMTLLIILANSLLISYGAGAAAEEAFATINESVCAFVNVMRSGFTYVIVLGAIVVGGIMRAAGSRAGMGVIIGGLIGGFIVLIAPSIATVVFPTATAC